MADAPVDDCQDRKEDADKKKNPLDEKSKEDLIKLVKKYLSLLQKSKNKTDELTEKCLILDQEKKAALNNVEVLQHELELKADKVSSADKDQLIEELKQKLKEAAEENNSHVPKLRENEEQLQCLSMQLKSLKDSCQCIQEENVKLQKLNEEKLGEIKQVNDLYENFVSLYNKKVNECNALLNMKESFEEKYEASVDKVHSLQMENESLRKANKNLREQKSLENQNEANLTDIGNLFVQLQAVTDENVKLKKQLNSRLPEVYQADSTDLGDEFEKLKNNVTVLEQQKGSLEKEKIILQSELDECHVKLGKLEEEVKNLVASSQLNDYKTGIEFALLHGATTESVIHPVEQRGSKFETVKSMPPNFCEETKDIYKAENVCSIEEDSGFEYALLQGGDFSNMVPRNNESSAYKVSIPHEIAFATINASDKNDLISKYEVKIKEKEVEMEKLKKNLDEYSMLCRDTLEENTALRSKIEELISKSKTSVKDQGNNTQLEYLEHSKKAIEYQEDFSSMAPKDVEQSVCGTNIPCEKILDVMSTSDKDDLISKYEAIIEEKEVEMEKLKKNLDEYSMLCRDTLDENTMLRSKIEKSIRENKTTASDQENNTELQYLERSKCAIEYQENFSGIVSNEVEQSVCGSSIPREKIFDVMNASDNDDLISEYKVIIEEKDVEIESLKKTLDEYYMLFKEENTLLRSKIEELTKNETTVTDYEDKTDFKSLEHSKNAFECQVKISSTSVAETENLRYDDLIKFYESYNYLCNRIIEFCQKIQSKKSFDSEHNLSHEDPFELIQRIENLFDLLVIDLEEKKKELNCFNLQLELLVIAVKQGVRQKTSTMSYEVKNSLEENMNMLKQILEELTMRTSCFESKKIIQSNTENDMQMALDELAQLKELNQFLEVENRELNTELKKLKSNLSDSENKNSEKYVHQQNSELYSINESSEFDDKTHANLKTYLDKEYVNTSDVSIQVFPSVKDSFMQIESDIVPEHRKVAENRTSESQTDSAEGECLKDVEKLANENESLKKVIIEKSNLVENIHCEMDNLMTKIEDLTSELHIKEDDLKHSQCLNEDLKKMLAEAQNIKEVKTALYDSLSKDDVLRCHVSMQAIPSVKDSVSQIESDFGPTDKEIAENKNADSQTDPSAEEKHQKHIDQLTSENELLQKVITEKSNLVENIHCQMDNLMTKIEELTGELKVKNDDLKHSQCVNADLKKMLKEAENVKYQQVNAFKIANDIILDIKLKNNNLSEEVKVLTSTYKELIANVSGDILNNIQRDYENIDYMKEVCDHKDNNINSIKEWINEFIKDFENWQNFMDQMTPELSELDLSVVERSTEDSSKNFHFKEICNDNTCLYITEKINQLNSCKAKLFSVFYKHLSNDYRSLVDNLHNYKTNIIPNIEKNLVELERKVNECTCMNGSKKEVKAVSESMQESTLEKSLKNSLADTEVKMNKFRQIALKLKKDLTLSKEQYNDALSEKEKLQKQNVKLIDEMNKITEDQCKYVQNYQTLQNEFDKLQDNCEAHKASIKKLEDDLASKLVELTSSKEQILELDSRLKSSKHLLDSNATVKKELDNRCADLESKIIVLESKIGEKEQKINSMESDTCKYVKDLNAAQEDIKNLKYQLELAQKEGNKKSLLDLEMADYERSITEMNNQIKKKEDEIEELQKEIQSLKDRNSCLQEELKSTESLKDTEAKRAESLKEILDKTKLELSKVKEHEAELLSKNTSLEVQLESVLQQEENFKLQLSQTSAQIQHLQDVIKTSSENHQRIARSFEQKISNQKEEIHIAHKEVESVKQEFENYKIRVHSVLKQQKTVTPAVTTVDGDLTEKLETINEKLKLQVKDLSEKLTAVSLEYETLQEEHDALVQRYNKALEDREQKDKEWQQRLELVNTEKTRLRATQEELSSQHLLQNEMLVATYKKQIKIMSEEHKKIVNDLQKQLDAADVEIARLQRDQQKLQGLPVTPVPQDSSSSFDLLSQERQEGEGSENTDEANTPIRQLSLATIPTSGFLPFEKLLQSPIEPGTPASYISNYDSEKLVTDLSTANKKIDHLSELLNDSESTNMRLSEQVRVLKDEVRRLENNKEREQHAENLEYLKNVFIKFATLQPGSEKAMLIPVLTTMLKLSSNEQHQLKSIAGDMQADDNVNASWGSYLHRWSGLS